MRSVTRKGACRQCSDLVEGAGVEATANLLGGGEREGFERDFDFSGVLVGREGGALALHGFPQKGAGLFRGGFWVEARQGVAIGGDQRADLFAGLATGGVGQDDDGPDERIAGDGLLDLFGVNVFALTVHDEGFGASADGDVALGVEGGQIAGAEPIAIVGGLGGFGIAPVAAEGDGAADLKLADALVVGTPCYWGNVPGQLKVLFDRMVYGMMGESRRAVPVPLMQGKRAAVVATCSTPWPFNRWFRQSSGTVRALREVFRWSGIRLMATVECGGRQPARPLSSREEARCRRVVRKLHPHRQSCV